MEKNIRLDDVMNLKSVEGESKRVLQFGEFNFKIPRLISTG